MRKDVREFIRRLEAVGLTVGQAIAALPGWRAGAGKEAHA
jgi:hypothetical protein